MRTCVCSQIVIDGRFTENEPSDEWKQSHYLFFFLIEVQLIYNVVLVSGVQLSDSYIYI